MYSISQRNGSLLADSKSSQLDIAGRISILHRDVVRTALTPHTASRHLSTMPRRLLEPSRAPTDLIRPI
ncbi:hypothetical protein OCU04_009025 [Sclerotinia nivalis]|uniref:Uncharacterized protein n=1 Tax=Sclerotinia nivalis TaxID=352851 RepID=A0A9X0AGN8_9HELO|nr:hypothetical protein OCU04_009025 [Sclerotinia nivalis]